MSERMKGIDDVQTWLILRLDATESYADLRWKMEPDSCVEDTDVIEDADRLTFSEAKSLEGADDSFLAVHILDAMAAMVACERKEYLGIVVDALREQRKVHDLIRRHVFGIQEAP